MMHLEDMAEKFSGYSGLSEDPASHMYGDIALNLTVNRHGRKWKSFCRKISGPRKRVVYHKYRLCELYDMRQEILYLMQNVR